MRVVIAQAPGWITDLGAVSGSLLAAGAFVAGTYKAVTRAILVASREVLERVHAIVEEKLEEHLDPVNKRLDRVERTLERVMDHLGVAGPED
jgi:hypothetical protein